MVASFRRTCPDRGNHLLSGHARGQLTKCKTNDRTTGINAWFLLPPEIDRLLEAAGLEDTTPAEFEQAVEDGNDPSPAAIAETLTLVGDKQVRALIYNVQTEGVVTANLRDAAQRAGVPVVEVTETLPEGTDYITWLTDTVQSLADAVAAD